MKYINNYETVIKDKKQLNSIIAILCKDNIIQYVCIEIGNRQSIEQCIGKTDGKAISINNKDIKYWMLMGSDGLLLFRQDDIKKYTDISNIDEDLMFAEYLYSMF